MYDLYIEGDVCIECMVWMYEGEREADEEKERKKEREGWCDALFGEV